jgi:penicillin-binding protein 1B
VVWVGNDQNQPTGLYGATGAMRVWSGHLLAPAEQAAGDRRQGPGLAVGRGGNATNAECPGARRFRLRHRLPAAVRDPARCRRRPHDESGGWRDWFGFGKDEQQAPQQQPQQPPQPQPAPQEEQ